MFDELRGDPETVTASEEAGGAGGDLRSVRVVGCRWCIECLGHQKACVLCVPGGPCTRGPALRAPRARQQADVRQPPSAPWPREKVDTQP